MKRKLKGIKKVNSILEFYDIDKVRLLEEKLGYKFNNINLIVDAITHSSYANELKIKSNERLEFLGDSILGLVISRKLYTKNELLEGEMTKIRSNIVCEESLYKIATKNEFEKIVRVGQSQKTEKNISKTILSDMVEAVIAAIYLDSNFETVEKIIEEQFGDIIDEAIKNPMITDYKSYFQELMQVDGIQKNIEYTIIKAEGPPHDLTFTVELLVNGKSMSQGVGKNKKEAQMLAAKKAIEKLEKEK